MDFNEFQNKLTKENRFLKLIFSLILLFLVIILVVMLFNKTYFITKGGSIFKERLLSEDVCRLGFQSLVTGELNSLLIDEQIIKLVEDEPFELEIDQILKLSSEKLNQCKIILKSEEKLLSFMIGLKEDSSFPFNYKIIQVDEVTAPEAI